MCAINSQLYCLCAHLIWSLILLDSLCSKLMLQMKRRSYELKILPASVSHRGKTEVIKKRERIVTHVCIFGNLNPSVIREDRFHLPVRNVPVQMQPNLVSKSIDGWISRCASCELAYRFCIAHRILSWTLHQGHLFHTPTSRNAGIFCPMLPISLSKLQINSCLPSATKITRWPQASLYFSLCAYV